VHRDGLSVGPPRGQVPQPPASYAEKVGGGYGHLREEQLRGVLGGQADLVQLRAAVEARHAALDDQQAQPAAPVAPLLIKAGSKRNEQRRGAERVHDRKEGADRQYNRLTENVDWSAPLARLDVGLGIFDCRKDTPRSIWTNPEVRMSEMGHFRAVGCLELGWMESPLGTNTE